MRDNTAPKPARPIIYGLDGGPGEVIHYPDRKSPARILSFEARQRGGDVSRWWQMVADCGLGQFLVRRSRGP